MSSKLTQQKLDNITFNIANMSKGPPYTISTTDYRRDVTLLQNELAKAEAAVAEERERCAVLAETASLEGRYFLLYYQTAQFRTDIAAAIRQEPEDES